jgi:penicillin-insensitive murein endopeptidase
LGKSDLVRLISLTIFGSLLAWTATVCGAPAARGPAKSTSTASLSIGSPNHGRLDGGRKLSAAPYLRVVPYYQPSTARFGLPALTGLIERAARKVARRFPDAVLNVGDLSRREGGELERHHSHKTGRDADLGFYLRSVANKPLAPERFVTFSPRGEAVEMPGAVFDEARNWALVEALVEDQETRVTHIFVARHIRARLLRYAEQHKVAPEVRQRAAELMIQPSQAAHDDHFHVRIGCPPDQGQRCVEYALLRSPRAVPGVVRVRLRSGDERTLPVLPAVDGTARGAANAEEDDDTPRAMRTPPLGRDHVGRRPLSKEDEADNLDP